MQKILIILAVVIGIIIYYTMLPKEDEAIKLVKALFLESNLDYELKIEEDTKLHFESFSRHFDDSKIILLFSTSIDVRYDFVIDPEGEMPFLITLAIFIFDRPRFWIHRGGIENYIKLYEKMKREGKIVNRWKNQGVRVVDW